MKKIQTILKRTAVVAIVVLIALTVVITSWEVVRPDIVDKFSHKTEIKREVPEPTDFELYVASKEVQEELELMWKRHQRDTLTKEITELETSKR